MIFSDRDIRKLLEQKSIVVDPFPDLLTQLGACSLDLRLGNQFSLFERNDTTVIDVRNPLQSQSALKHIKVDQEESFVLHPGVFVLGTTLEWIELPDDIVARLEGRSSLGRLGIIVHATASIVDPGWKGKIALELANHGSLPVALYYGMRICALTFEPVSTPVEVPYWQKADAKYAYQQDASFSLISKDVDIKHQED